MKYLITMTFFAFSLSVMAVEMEVPKGVGEVTKSLGNIDGTSPCADRNNDGISDCQQHLGKRPGAQNGLPSETSTAVKK